MSSTAVENVVTSPQTYPEREVGAAEQELRLDLDMAALIAEIDALFTPEAEVALDRQRAYNADGNCNLPTQEWRE